MNKISQGLLVAALISASGAFATTQIEQSTKHEPKSGAKSYKIAHITKQKSTKTPVGASRPHKVSAQPARTEPKKITKASPQKSTYNSQLLGKEK